MEDEALDNSLRSLYLNYQAGESLKPKLVALTEGQKIPLNLVFSNGANTTHVPVTFTVNKQKKLVYTGDIKVDGYNTSSKWYVTAIYEGTRNQNSYGFEPALYKIGPLGATQSLSKGGNGNHLDIPFVSGWTPVKGSSKNGVAQGSFSVKLKPMGYLLRLKIQNRRDHKIMLRNLRPMKNEQNFFFSANFTPTISTEAFESGAYPAISKYASADNLHTDGTETRLLHWGVTIPGETESNGTLLERGDTTPTELGGVILWVMPKTKLDATNNKFKLRVEHYKQGAEWYFPFEITLDPADEVGLGGLSGTKTLAILNDHKIYRKPYTIDYVAKANIDANGNEVAVGSAGESWNFNSYPFKEHAGNMNPTDWSNIIPRSTSYTNGNYDGGASGDGTQFFNGSTGTFSLTNTLAPGSYTKKTDGSTRILYAIRTLTESDNNKGSKAAFRYHLQDNGTMTVEMVHLSFDASALSNYVGTWEQVQTPAYWEKAYQYGEVVKRIFPGGIPTVPGGKRFNTYNYMGIKDKDLQGTLWNYTHGRIGLGLLANYALAKNAVRQVRLKSSTPLPLDPVPTVVP